MTTKINDAAKQAIGVVVRIDQGDYLQERGGYDWGRADIGQATTYESIADAEAAITRLRAPAREIEPALNC